jgi:hypothetical protein
MSINSDALREYLCKHSVSRSAMQAALDTLTPFEDVDEKHGYPLTRGSVLNVGELARAMWTAFERPVTRCWFLHAKVPVVDQPWTVGATRLDDLVVATYADRCRPRFMRDTAFEQAYAQACGNRLYGAITKTLASTGLLAKSLHPSVMLNAVLRMRIALCASERAEAKNLEPLSNILLRAIPMAGGDRKRGEWCVVVQ